MTDRPKDCPLYKHKNGQWTKRIKGKLKYFGTDLDEALKRYATEKDHLLAGLTPPSRSPGVATLAELGNVYLENLRQLIRAGELTQRSLSDHRATLDRLVGIVGKNSQPSQWSPLDFAAIKDKLSVPKEHRDDWCGAKIEKRSRTSVNNDVVRIRAFLNWCHVSELMPPPRYGLSFDALSREDRRAIKKKAGRKDLSPETIKLLIGRASVAFRPILLLGINAGIGNADIGEMTFGDLPKGWRDMDEVFVDLPRRKTNGDRRFVLWPETKQAIAEYLDHRADPASRSDSDLLFLTRFGQSWYREKAVGDRHLVTDAIANAFKKLREDLGIERGTYYDLRRTFNTVAGGTLDIAAIRLVMGHIAPKDDMTAHYDQGISDERLKNVCDYVRNWLYGTQAESTTKI